ncbi:MAG: N-acetyltransferase [Phycisphaerales bacterium]
MIVTRPETDADHDAVRIVNERAFEGPVEAALVDRLRAVCPDALSIVAEVKGDVVGHILFTPVTIAGRDTGAAGLAPMAVLPEHQRRGIGAALVGSGLEALRARGCPLVVVLGHPAYYPRFGFRPASELGLRCQWEGVPDGVFMAMRLDDTADAGTGVARYHGAFDASA